jgi:hypothetical protein
MLTFAEIVFCAHALHVALKAFVHRIFNGRNLYDRLKNTVFTALKSYIYKIQWEPANENFTSEHFIYCLVSIESHGPLGLVNLPMSIVHVKLLFVPCNRHFSYFWFSRV